MCSQFSKFVRLIQFSDEHLMTTKITESGLQERLSTVEST